MSAQDKTERVLRELHVLLANSEAYNEDENKVLVDKKKMLELFSDLNKSIYEIMDEYDLTKQGRDRAEREARKKREEIVNDANKMAEDVYAASVLYTDEALRRVQDIMQNTADSIKEMYEKIEENLKEEKQGVRSDQLELKSHLQDLKDTDKYLKIIKEENKRIEKEKKKNEEKEPSAFVAVKPEIKVNEEYFKEHGLSLEEETEEEQPEEKMEAVAPEISVNLDSDYFKWKETGEIPDLGAEEVKPEKQSFLSKILKP